MKNGFTARAVFFEDMPGYMVSQYHDGEKVVEQFIPETSFEAFCRAIGTTPTIIE